MNFPKNFFKPDFPVFGDAGNLLLFSVGICSKSSLESFVFKKAYTLIELRKFRREIFLHLIFYGLRDFAASVHPGVTFFAVDCHCRNFGRWVVLTGDHRLGRVGKESESTCRSVGRTGSCELGRLHQPDFGRSRNRGLKGF